MLGDQEGLPFFQELPRARVHSDLKPWDVFYKDEVKSNVSLI